jgi:hypothetical protein
LKEDAETAMKEDAATRRRGDAEKEDDEEKEDDALKGETARRSFPLLVFPRRVSASPCLRVSYSSLIPHLSSLLFRILP